MGFTFSFVDSMFFLLFFFGRTRYKKLTHSKLRAAFNNMYVLSNFEISLHEAVSVYVYSKCQR